MQCSTNRGRLFPEITVPADGTRWPVRYSDLRKQMGLAKLADLEELQRQSELDRHASIPISFPFGSIGN